MIYDNFTSLFLSEGMKVFDIAIENNNYIIMTFIAIISCWVGYKYNQKNQRSNNKREKAKEIIKEFRTNFLQLLNSQTITMNNFQYLILQEKPFKISSKLNENTLKEYLIKTGLFKIENGSLIAVYTQDKLFNSYAKKIIENVRDYESNIIRYNNCIKELNSITVYPDFEKEIQKLFKKRYGTELSGEERMSFFLKVLYLVSLTGYRKLYSDGRVWVVELGRDNCLELQSIIQSDMTSKKMSDELLTTTKNIETSLETLKKIIEELHNKWQNTLFI
jgi:hypothetical protein